MERQVIGVIVLTVLIVSVAGAGTVTDTGSTNPSGIIEQHVANNRTARAQRDSAGTGSNERTFGQTFLSPGTGSWNGVSLKSSNARNYTGLLSKLQVKVFDMNDGDGVPAGDGPDDAGLPDSDNTLLGTFDFDVSSLSYAADTWLQFDFDSPLALAAGRQYGFLVFWDSDNAANTFDVRHSVDAGSTLAGGTMRTNTSNYNDASWTGANPWNNVQPLTSDLTFVVHGEVPEPATMALLGMAACGLGGYVRKRRRA